MISISLNVDDKIKIIIIMTTLEEDGMSIRESEIPVNVSKSTLQCIDKLVRNLDNEVIQTRNEMMNLISVTNGS